MRLALAVSALFLIVAPLHAQKAAPKKASSRTAHAAASDTTKNGVKQAGSKRSSAKPAVSKPASPKVATAKPSSAKRRKSTKQKASGADAAKKETAKAAPPKTESTASATNGGGQYIGSKQGHTYYLATCKAAQSLTPANRVQFSSEGDAKRAGYAHSKQKGC